MKKDIHPDNYRPVIFHDTSSGERFLISSTIIATDTDKWSDDVEYPRVDIEISSSSHPFYTGTENIVDTAGRVERFKKRAQAAAKK